MFGKKKQPVPQQIVEEYSSDQSQPLVQEVDDSYEPTDKQVKQYALEVLGMNLPEDQNLMYLARQGLKAPIPQNWIPYQSRTGQIYYKHKITQQKIYEHPTDIEYRKIYSQQKQKMTRKNLKSIALKQNIMQQQGYSNQTSSLIGGNNALISNLSNISGISANEESQQLDPTIDQQLIEQWQNEVKQTEIKEQKQWKQFQKQQEERYQKNIKKYYEQYLEDMENIKNPNTAKDKTTSKILEDEKQRIKRSFQENFENNNRQLLKLYQKQQQSKLQQYKAVYEQDNSIKIKKFQQQVAQNYEQTKTKIQEIIKKNQQKQQKLKIQRKRELERVRKQLQDPNNTEIQQMLNVTFRNKMADIQKQYELKLKSRENQLSNTLIEMRKILGIDKSHQIQELAQKKNRLQNLSAKKISAYKQKQLQAMQNQLQKELQKSQAQIQTISNRQAECLRLKQQNQLFEVKLKHEKQKISSQFDDRLKKRNKQIEQTLQIQKNKCEREMNERITRIQNSYIEQQRDKNSYRNSESKNLTDDYMLRQKQQQIHHKQEIVKMIEKQLHNQQKQLTLAKVNQQIFSIINKFDNNTEEQQNGLQQYFQNAFKRYNIQYRSPQYIKQLQNLRKYTHQYKEDKKMLAKISKILQQKTMMGFRGTQSYGSSGLVRKYNEDVRKMRQNQKMISKFEMLLKKAQIGTKNSEALQKLQQFIATEFQYQQIDLKKQLQASQNIYQSHQLQSIDIKNKPPMNNWNTETYVDSKSMDDAIQKHSHFLNSMKHKLNRKLYELRYDSKF